MSITIRKGGKQDYPELLSFIKDLAAFEESAESVTNSVERMNEESGYFDVLVAEHDDGTMVGVAIYFFAYFTRVGKSLYLDDLIVSKEHRGEGIGTQLLEKLFVEAKKEQCKRVRRQVLDRNENAIGFYEKFGATIEKSWYNCDFYEAMIQKLG